MRGNLLAVLMVALVAPASATEVISSQPGSVAATLYQSYRGAPDIALITETRSISLAAGENVVRFEGVASTLIPQTVQVTGLPNPPRQADFDFALFDAATVLGRSVGRRAELVQSPPRAAEIRRIGTLVADQGIVVFRDGEGVETFGCGGPPARLIVNVPMGLRSKPSLSVRVQADRAGRYTVRLSYLAERIRWRAVYVARIGHDSHHVDLEGRIVIENGSATSFERVPTRFVVGEVPRLRETRAPWVVAARPKRDCWGTGRTSDPVIDDRHQLVDHGVRSGAGTAASFAAAAPGRAVDLEALGDLKLYRLDEPVRIAAQQQKMFTFMAAKAVKAEPVFVVPAYGERKVVGASAQQAWLVTNTKAVGLGIPLPHGSATLYRDASAYLGTDQIRFGVPVEGSFELAGDGPGDVIYDHEVTSYRMRGTSHYRTRAVTLRNTSGKPATVEIRLPQTHVRAIDSGLDGVKPSSNAFVWRTSLSANEERRVVFTTVDAN